MRRTILGILFQILILQLLGQDKPEFLPPLKIPIYLSGNFGEIREDHFHSGIDIKTQGTTGQHVFAIGKGYVSRIKVQANGYGKSIYLSHPEGYTSVYGHLDAYRDDIAAYVKEIQYRRHSHQVDIYPEPGEFPVERGDFIAYSGNSGGSFGPHLHFEIRDSRNQHPVNALEYGFGINDHIAPKFHALFIRPLDGKGRMNSSGEKQELSLVLDHGVYMPPWGTKLEGAGRMGLGVEVIDYLDGASNRCGIYTLEVRVNGRTTFSLIMDEFAFSETRYANAHSDYQERIRSGRNIRRLYRLPNDRLRIYRALEDDGILTIEEDSTYKIRVIATDVAGNRAEMQCTIRGVAGGSSLPGLAAAGGPEEAGRHLSYTESNKIESGDVTVEIPVNALYEDLDFRFAELEGKDVGIRNVYRIHDPSVPLHRPFILSVRLPEIPVQLQNKLVFVGYDPEEEEWVAAGGDYREGRLTSSLQAFGDYAIAVDTVAPEIEPLNGTGSGDLSKQRSMRFTVLDELSGVEKYEGYIDNRWALFEYDPKNDLVSYAFDANRLGRGREHELELYVTDATGNTSLFHSTFTW